MKFKKGDIVWFENHPFNPKWTKKKFKYISPGHIPETQSFVELLEETDGFPIGYLANIGHEGLILVERKNKTTHFPNWW